MNKTMYWESMEKMLGEEEIGRRIGRKRQRGKEEDRKRIRGGRLKIVGC